jgi:hypothetical protein
VVATLYEEIVVERFYPGTVQLERNLHALVEAAEQALKPERHRTIVRVDRGSGRDADVNWLLTREYHILIKVKNWKRTQKLARSILTWHPEPKVAGRGVGWATRPHCYARPTRQLVIRKRKEVAQFGPNLGLGFREGSGSTASCGGGDGPGLLVGAGNA